MSSRLWMACCMPGRSPRAKLKLPKHDRTVCAVDGSVGAKARDAGHEPRRAALRLGHGLAEPHRFSALSRRGEWECGGVRIAICDGGAGGFGPVLRLRVTARLSTARRPSHLHERRGDT